MDIHWVKEQLLLLEFGLLSLLDCILSGQEEYMPLITSTDQNDFM
jgi:hypothetical protein